MGSEGREADAGRRGWAVLCSVLTRRFPPRETRTTAPPGSAGPPAPAPRGRSALGATPRPHGRPSTTAGQVLGPPGPLTLREAGFLVVFPAINQSLMYTRRVWVAGGRWRTRPVRGGPWCPGRRVVTRQQVPLWVEGLWVKLTGTAEHVGPALGIHVSVEQTHRWKEPGSSCSHGSGKRKAASVPGE